MAKRTTLPKPTAVIIEKYEALNAKCAELQSHNQFDEANIVLSELTKLIEQYDWCYQVFTDHQTGKKGLVDVKGKVIVPARYDDFCETYSLFIQA